MTVTLGSFSTNALTAQPFGYEGDARDGLTAQQYRIAGLLTAAQWQALVSEYNTWRNARITDADTLSSGTVGTTVSLSITSANGLSISGVACWFTEAPTGEQTGDWVSATATLVNAAQALAVLLRGQEKQRQNSEATTPNLGTVSLGSATVTLTAPMETRRDGPQVSLTATGTSLITGPRTSHKVRAIEGRITAGTPDDVLAWYDNTIAAAASTGTWFPISEPQFTAEAIITGGAKSTRYSVSVQALEIR